MAIGDKKPVVMQGDRGLPGGIATLDEQGNVPSGQLGNAVSKAGDTMTGPLGILRDDVTTVLDVDGGSKCSFWRVAYDSKWSQLIFNESMLQYALTLDSGLTWAVHNILHTGNKPQGAECFYTGNGDSGQRVIPIGDIAPYGALLIVSTGGAAAIVTAHGAIYKTSTTVAGLEYTEGVYSGGQLVIQSAHVALNAAGVTYYYQAL